MGNVVMKAYKYTIAAFLAILLIGLSPLVFGNTSKSDEIAAVSTEECALLSAFIDPEVMAHTMTNPAKFTEFMVAMNNPATSQKLMNCSMESEQWNKAMANFSNPTKMMNAMVPFMNPQMYMNWMAASMNPQTYQFMFAYMNPAFYSQWMTATMNPQFYPIEKMMDPKWAQESTAWMMDPSSFQKMFESFYQAPVVADATVSE